MTRLIGLNDQAIDVYGGKDFEKSRVLSWKCREKCRHPVQDQSLTMNKSWLMMTTMMIVKQSWIYTTRKTDGLQIHRRSQSQYSGRAARVHMHLACWRYFCWTSSSRSFSLRSRSCFSRCRFSASLSSVVGIIFSASWRYCSSSSNSRFRSLTTNTTHQQRRGNALDRVRLSVCLSVCPVRGL